MEGILFLQPCDKFLGKPRAVDDFIPAAELAHVSDSVLAANVSVGLIKIVDANATAVPPSGDHMADLSRIIEGQAALNESMAQSVSILTEAVGQLQTEVKRLKAVPRTRRGPRAKKEG